MTQQQRRLRGTRGALATILALSVFAGPGAAQELTGRFETIDIPGAIVTQVRGITADGRLVGYYATELGVVHGFLLDGGTFTTIDVPFAEARANFSSAQGINARGDIVGIWLLPGVGPRGYLLEAHGGFSTIEVPGTRETRPRSINASGEIVGWSVVPGLGGTRGFIRDRAGEYQSIAIPGARQTHAHSINDRGDIVGKYFIGFATPVSPIDVISTSTAPSHGFLLTADGYTTLDVPFPGGVNTGAYGINAAGDIVGCYTAADGLAKTFVRDRHGEYRSFEAPGALFTCAAAINAGGDIAGQYVDANGVGAPVRVAPAGVEDANIAHSGVNAVLTRWAAAVLLYLPESATGQPLTDPRWQDAGRGAPRVHDVPSRSVGHSGFGKSRTQMLPILRTPLFLEQLELTTAP